MPNVPQIFSETTQKFGRFIITTNADCFTIISSETTKNLVGSSVDYHKQKCQMFEDTSLHVAVQIQVEITASIHHNSPVYLLPRKYSGTPKCGHFWDPRKSVLIREVS